MKKINFLLILLVFGCVSLFNSCDDSNNGPPLVESIILTEPKPINNELTIILEETPTVRLRIAVRPGNASTQAVSITNQNADIFTVNEEGILTAKNFGQDVITIKSTDGSNISASYTVKVVTNKVKIESINMAEGYENIPLDVNASLDVSINVVVSPQNATNKVLNYSSSNDAIVTVDENGLLKGIAEGEAVITVTATDGSEVTTTFTVTVTKPLIFIEEIILADEIKAETSPHIMTEEGTYNLAASTTVLPAEANKLFSYTVSNPDVLEVSEQGVVTTKAVGTCFVTITPADGGSGEPVKAYFHVIRRELLNRSAWTVTTSVSYGHVPDGSTGMPMHLFDNSTTTFLSMVKPGKTYGAYTTPAGHELHFIIDLKAKEKFDYIKWDHRSNNANNYLRVWGIGLYGSNDGTNFVKIQDNIDIPYNNVSPASIDIPASEYQYIKVVIEKWSDNSGGSTSGGTVQIAEVNLGRTLK